MAERKSKAARKKTIGKKAAAKRGAGAAPFKTPLRGHLADVRAYPPGKPIEEVQRDYGLDDVVKLASNENPLGPSPKAAKRMREAAAEMNLYPDGGGYYLKQAIARKLNIKPRELILGNGSDETTTLLAACYVGPGRSIVTSDYAFVRYRMAAQIAEGRSIIVPMKRYAHDVTALAAAVRRDTMLLFVDNPCNPTGTILTAAQLKRLLGAVPERVIVVVDEAYYEYARDGADYPDTLALRAKHPNLMVTRTFSKAYGLAGLRIGYGIARPEIIEDLDRVRAPFNCNRMAQAAAMAAWRDALHLRRTSDANDAGKRLLAREFGRMGIAFVPTHANFFLCDFGPVGRTGGEVYEFLLRRGVIVRPMDGYGLTDHARISIGTPEENRRLAGALSELIFGE